MKKAWMYFAGGCLAVGAIALIVLYLKLGAIVRAAVETWGPKITRTEVRLRSVSLSPFSGSGRIRGLFIGNPEGFKSPFAFQVDSVKVSVDVKSLRTHRIVVKEIVVDGPEVTFESSLAGSNLSRLQRNVESFVPSSKGGGSASETKVEIGRFKVTHGKVRLSWRELGSQGLTVALPEIELQGIGRESGGATVGQAAARMFGAITKAALSAAAGAGGALKGGIGAVGTVGKNVSGLIQGFLRKKP